MAENLITEIFDEQKISEQIDKLKKESEALLTSIRKNVEEIKVMQGATSTSTSGSEIIKNTEKLNTATDNLKKTKTLYEATETRLQKLQEQQVFLSSEEGKALTNLINKEKEELKIKQEQMGQEKLQNELAEKLNNLLNSESNTISALNEENKKLEKLKQQLNIRDEEQLKKITEINEKINTNTALIKKQNTEEQNRTSGIGKYKEAIEAVIKSEGNYKTQLLKLKNTMSELESTIQEHGDETGELAKQYALLQKRAGELTDAQDDMQQRINFLADDYGKFKAVLSGVRAAMGIVSVFSGFTDILGIHSKRLEAVTAKMTALIATMQGLKEVQELLNKDNYFRQLIKTTPAIAKLGGKVGAISKALKGVVVTAGIASTAFAAFIAVIAGFGVVTKKVVEKDLKKTKDEIDKIKASTDNATTVMTNFGKSLNMTKFDGLVSQLQNVAKSVKEVIAEFVRMSVMTAITDKLTEAINAQLNATMVRLRNEQKIKKLEEKKREQEATNTENARLRREAQAFTGGPEHTSAAQLGDIIPTATEAQKVKEYENAIDELKIEIKEADKVASGFKSEINELVKNSAEITATTTTIVTDALAGLFPEIEAFRKLQPEVKKTTDTIKTEIKEAVKSITSEEEEDEMYTEQIERTHRKLKGLIKEAEKGIPPIQIDIPIEFEDPKIVQLKSALETLSDEITKQLGFFYTKINTEIDGEGNVVWKKLLPIEDLRSISNSVKEVMTGLMNTSQQVLNNVVGNAIKMSNEEYNTRTQAAENEANIAKEALETSLLNEEDRAEAEERIEKEKQRKLSDLKNEQAKKERDSQAAEIAINAVMAFASTLATAKGGMAAKLIQAAAVSAVTLSQLAVLYSKPLPKYEKGGTVGVENTVIAGEKGRELAFTPNNKVLMLDSKGIYNLPTGTIIKDNKTTEKILKEKNINISVSRDYIEIDRQKYINKYLNKTL